MNDDILEIGQAGTPAKNIIIKGIIFDGDKTNQTGGPRDIDIVRAEHLHIFQCYFKESYQETIYIQGNVQKDIWIRDNHFNIATTPGTQRFCIYSLGNSGSRNLKIIDNKFENFWNTCIYLGAMEDFDVVGNVLYCGSQTAGQGILLTAGMINGYVGRNHIIDAFAEGIWATGVFGTTIDGNIIENCGSHGIRTSIQIGVVSNNQIYNGGAHGIFLDDGNIELVVIGNSIYYVQNHGIALITNITYPIGCLIVGNLITSPSQVLTNTWDGIFIDIGWFCGVHVNHIVSTVAPRHRWGINESGSKNHLNGNSSHGAGTGGFSITGAGSVGAGNSSTV